MINEQIKKFFFFADSATMLLPLWKILKNDLDIIWIVYNKSVYKELIDNSVPKNQLILITLNFDFFKSFLIINKIIDKFMYSFFKLKWISFILGYKIKKIKNFNKNRLFLTDTSRLLSDLNFLNFKATIFHSITYKKHFLHSHNLKYNYIFLPGGYHKKRFQEKFREKKIPKIKIVGNLKKENIISSDSKINFYNKKLNLFANRKNIIFGPTFDSFESGRFLPNTFEDQSRSLRDLSNFLKNSNYNLIIKLHHYMNDLLKLPIFELLNKQKHVCIFKPIEGHDTLNSHDIIRYSDIVISDTSGLAITAISLDKKLIFLEPDSKFNWDNADTEKRFRPGYIVNDTDQIKEAINSYSNSDIFKIDRQNFLEKIFPEKIDDPYKTLKNYILKII